MAELTIKTDNKWKNFLYGYELTEKEKKEFDWIDKDDFEGHAFLRHNNAVYSLSEFLVTMPEELKAKGWHGFASDSAFSGVAIKISRDGEQYKGAVVIS